MANESKANPRIDFRRTAWINSNEDIIDELMESKELLKATREFIYQKLREEEENSRYIETDRGNHTETQEKPNHYSPNITSSHP